MMSPGRFLLVRPDRLGDLILSLPVAEELKRSIPGCAVHYIISAKVAGIAPMVNYVDGWIIDDESGKRLTLSNLSNRMKSGEFDCVMDLKPSWRSAAAGWLSRVNIRIGTSRRAYSYFYNRRVNVHRKSSGFHQTDLELRHLEPLGIESERIDPRLNVSDRGRTAARQLLDLNDIPYIVIHPGSGGSAPNWPAKNYVELAGILAAEADLEVVITGDQKNEIDFADCRDIRGRTDLETLAGILAGARIFISGSTGPLHMADALGTACVSFFADRNDIGPVRWGPRRNIENVLLPTEPCACSNIRSCRCLERISVETAYKKIAGLLRTGRKLLSM